MSGTYQFTNDHPIKNIILFNIMMLIML